MSEPTEEELQKSYERALQDELTAGTARVVAEGRALIARLRAQIAGLEAIDADPGLAPEEALRVGDRASHDDVYEAALEAQLGAGATRPIAEARALVASMQERRKASPRPPTPVKPRETKPSAPQPERPAVPQASGAPRAEEPAPPQGPVGEESPDEAYDRVLAEQRAAGSSDAVAVARAKVARIKAQRALDR